MITFKNADFHLGNSVQDLLLKFYEYGSRLLTQTGRQSYGKQTTARDRSKK